MIQAIKHEVARLLWLGALKLDRGCTLYSALEAITEETLKKTERTLNRTFAPGSQN